MPLVAVTVAVPLALQEEALVFVMVVDSVEATNSVRVMLVVDAWSPPVPMPLTELPAP